MNTADKVKLARGRLSAMKIAPPNGIVSSQEAAKQFEAALDALESDITSKSSGSVSDQRALSLATDICNGKFSAVQGAVEIMDYATDAIAAEIMAGTLNASVPDDLRAFGWSVAVHNDYRLNGKLHTFWLFTKYGREIHGEGETDAAALNAVRAQLP